jgi:hypothetical protein
VSVDTYLKGKKTDGYKRIHEDDLLVLIAPSLTRFANELHLVTKKKMIGKKLLAVVHHDPSKSCQI